MTWESVDCILRFGVASRKWVPVAGLALEYSFVRISRSNLRIGVVLVSYRFRLKHGSQSRESLLNWIMSPSSTRVSPGSFLHNWVWAHGGLVAQMQESLSVPGASNTSV